MQNAIDEPPLDKVSTDVVPFVESNEDKDNDDDFY